MVDLCIWCFYSILPTAKKNSPALHITIFPLFLLCDISIICPKLIFIIQPIIFIFLRFFLLKSTKNAPSGATRQKNFLESCRRYVLHILPAIENFSYRNRLKSITYSCSILLLLKLLLHNLKFWFSQHTISLDIKCKTERIVAFSNAIAAVTQRSWIAVDVIATPTDNRIVGVIGTFFSLIFPCISL